MANQNQKDVENETQDTPTAPPSGMVSLDSLASAIGASVASALELRDSKNKKVTFGEYQRRRNAGRSRLTREVFQNGFRLGGPGQLDNSLDNKQIDLLNQITHTGRYIDRKVEVILREEGADQVLEIRYNNKTKDQALELRAFIRSFTDMLEQIVEAQIMEDLEADERDGRKRKATERHFGDTKASREARERVGA
jgi:hypothetical protein